MRSMEMSAKTVEAAVQAACEALGVDRDDINVSYEVLEFPTRKLFKTIPAKVLVKVEEPEAEKPAEVSTKPAEVVENTGRIRWEYRKTGRAGGKRNSGGSERRNRIRRNSGE